MAPTQDHDLSIRQYYMFLALVNRVAHGIFCARKSYFILTILGPTYRLECLQFVVLRHLPNSIVSRTLTGGTFKKTGRKGQGKRELPASKLASNKYPAALTMAVAPALISGISGKVKMLRMSFVSFI